jgi:hypothetical protein
MSKVISYSISNNSFLDSNNCLDTNLLDNEDCVVLHQLFIQNDWYPIHYKANLITYSKRGYETDYFELRLNNNNTIHVVIPLKNTHYKTTFTNIHSAVQYVEKRLLDWD